MADDSLLREVDEDIRQEKLARMWKRFRTPLIAVVVLLVVGTAAKNIWEHHEAKKAGLAMQALDRGIVALEQKEPAQAADKFGALAQQSTGELKDIARLWQARALIAAKQDAVAVEVLNDLAKNPQGKDLIWRDFACLRLMGLNAQTPETCASAQSSSLAALRQQWAAASLWEQGKTDEAKALLEALVKNDAAPQAERDEAARLLRAVSAGEK
jgi:hypothetical protein